MRGPDLAAGLVVQLLLFERLDLGFGEDDAVFGNFRLQGSWALLEVGQIVAQPDRTYP